MKAIVTGGAGFIGSYIVDRLAERGYEITVIDNLSSGSIENISNHMERDYFRFIEADLKDRPDE